MRHFPGRAAEPTANSGAPAGASLAGLAGRDRLMIWSALIAVTVLAWLYLFYLDHRMSPPMAGDTAMAGMAMPWSAADFFVAFAMWGAMMVGMMLPAAAPVVLLFAGTHARRDGRRLPWATLLFGLGYVAVWLAFSAGAALAQGALHQAALLSPAASVSSAWIGGAILIAIGIYQWTPLKRACLRHCQSPLGFLMTHWRDGGLGALQMGMRHGIYCLGCCWALMGLLFVVGVMNLAWVAALTLFVLLEKLGPAGATLARVAGAALVVAGILSIAAR